MISWDKIGKAVLKNLNNPDESSCLHNDTEAAVLKEMPTI